MSHSTHTHTHIHVYIHRNPEMIYAPLVGGRSTAAFHPRPGERMIMQSAPRRYFARARRVTSFAPSFVGATRNYGYTGVCADFRKGIIIGDVMRNSNWISARKFVIGLQWF